MKHPNDPVSLELVAEWDGDVNTAYRFPHPDITYHDLTVVRVRAKMPGGQPVESLIPSFERVRITDPKSFSPYDPVTWQPWIDTEDLFKPRDLIRELREAPQLGVRFNPPPQRDRLFKILIEWIYAARLTEGWMEKHNLAVAELIYIEELRNLYWAAAGVAVERVQQRLHRDDDPKDRYGQLVLDEQLRGRPQVRSSRRRPFCFSCHQPGHIRADCPQMAQAPAPVSSPPIRRIRIFAEGWRAAPSVTPAQHGVPTRECPPPLLLVPLASGGKGLLPLQPYKRAYPDGDSPVRRPRPPLSSNPPLPHVVSTRPPRSRSLPIRALNQSAGEKPAADRNAILQAILRRPPNDPRTLQLRRRSRTDVGHDHMGQQGANLATYAAVLRGKGCSFKFHKRGSLPTFAASSPARREWVTQEACELYFS